MCRKSLKQRFGKKVVVFGNVSAVAKCGSALYNICLEDVKVQEDKKVVGHESHIWLNNYPQRGNSKVSDLVFKHDVKPGDRVGVRGIVRQYVRAAGSYDYDLYEIDVINKLKME